MIGYGDRGLSSNLSDDVFIFFVFFESTNKE